MPFNSFSFPWILLLLFKSLKLKSINFFMFKDSGIVENFSSILEDDSFSVSKYWIKPSRLKTILKNWKNIQIETSLVLLKIYNDYYELSDELDDIFNTQFIKWYIEHVNKIEYEFWDKDKSNFIQSFLRFAFSIFSSKEKIDKKPNLELMDDKKLILIISIIIIAYILLEFYL